MLEKMSIVHLQKKSSVYQCRGALSLATALTRMCEEQLARNARACDAWEGDAEAEKTVTSTQIRQNSPCKKPLRVSGSAGS